MILYNNVCNRRCDGIGRRDGLKIRWWRHRVGSSPTIGTISCEAQNATDQKSVAFCASVMNIFATHKNHHTGRHGDFLTDGFK